MDKPTFTFEEFAAGKAPPGASALDAFIPEIGKKLGECTAGQLRAYARRQETIVAIVKKMYGIE